MARRRHLATRSSSTRCNGLSARKPAASPCLPPNPRSVICSGQPAPWRPFSRFWRCATGLRRQRSTSTIRPSRRQSTWCPTGRANAKSTWYCRTRLGLAAPTRRWCFDAYMIDVPPPYPPPQAGEGKEGRTGMVSGERPNEFKRIAPRSPRAALEPERVPVPTRRSERVRHPLVMAGNAVFTVLILIAIAGGILFVVAKQRFEAPGPLEQDKIVNIPPRLGIRDIADLLVREGVIDHPWTFVVSAMLAKTHDDLRFGEYRFPKQASLHDVINTIIDGKAVQHQITIPQACESHQIVQRL